MSLDCTRQKNMESENAEAENMESENMEIETISSVSALQALSKLLYPEEDDFESGQNVGLFFLSSSQIVHLQWEPWVLGILDRQKEKRLKVDSMGCLGFLVEGTGACVLVDEAGSCLSGGQDHVWCDPKLSVKKNRSNFKGLTGKSFSFIFPFFTVIPQTSDENSEHIWNPEEVPEGAEHHDVWDIRETPE
ncbi:hypothetical protein J1605_010575 [Eschrichtius robustus]|uniref:Uncharacterized protein n=1 Tax=Eschrichtius robustus TaxID=9764 RepID=A0AB34GSU7_ESCRO|nr:hypothetical protein J1605_010575 [Eschrichtius robustus]